MTVQFYQTTMGKRFYEGMVPKIANGIGELNQHLEEANHLKRKELELKESELALKERELALKERDLTLLELNQQAKHE